MAEAARAFQSLDVFNGSLADMRNPLDVSGLRLPRWPRVRLLSRGEKRRRWRERLSLNAEPPHVPRAKSLVHQYERVLREMLGELMEGAYGENWPEERLPLCGCNDLVGKWHKKGGGFVLDHAAASIAPAVRSKYPFLRRLINRPYSRAETQAARNGGVDMQVPGVRHWFG